MNFKGLVELERFLRIWYPMNTAQVNQDRSNSDSLRSVLIVRIISSIKKMFFENCIHVNNVSRAYPPMLEWVSPPTPCPLLLVLLYLIVSPFVLSMCTWMWNHPKEHRQPTNNDFSPQQPSVASSASVRRDLQETLSHAPCWNFPLA